MAFVFTPAWDTAVEKTVRDFYDTLSEKDQRRFAAVQARQFGYGGVKYVAEVVGCSRRTIERGLLELEELSHDPAAGRIRRPGAGRKHRQHGDDHAAKGGNRHRHHNIGPPSARGEHWQQR